MSNNIPAGSSVTRSDVARENVDDMFNPSRETRVLLAIANDEVAEAAIRVTAALAESRHVAPTILQVVDPAPYAAPPMVPTIIEMAEALIGSSASEARREAISSQVERVCGRRMTWPVVSRLGQPAASIVSEAQRRRSELLILGLHHHGRLRHFFGVETIGHVLARARIPVLGVTRDLQGLPHSVLVGVDFSRGSLRVASLAARLIEPPGELVLAHAAYPKFMTLPEELEGDAAIDEEGIRALLDRLKGQVHVRPGVVIKTLRLTGDPQEALIDYAEHMGTPLIAVAGQQHSRTRQFLIGSVTRHILRDARWSVLVTPPDNSR